LFTHTSDAVFVVGRGARIVWWGPKAEQLLGVSAARALGRHCYDVFAGLSDSYGGPCRAACPRLEAARHGAVPGTMPIERVGPDGEKTPYTLGFVVDSSGEYMIHIVRECEAPTVNRWAGTSCPRQSGMDARPAGVGLLTPREREVLRLLASGAGSRAIAEQLSISGVTVRNHVRNVLEKLGVHSRLEAAAVAHQAGLI
jgi:DNA-binding CsgD family transcriptional regulator